MLRVHGGKFDLTAQAYEELEPYRVKKAVILAAGFGSRMMPATEDRPKPMVKVNGTRIIDSLLDSLVAVGIRDITIVGGYRYGKLCELLEKYPLELLGSSKKMRILVKLLDSAVRLPAQAHPDKAYSKKHFQSEYGKTESWMILDTRPDAKLYFRFKDGVGRESFTKAIDDSLTDKDAMERLMLYRIQVQSHIKFRRHQR